MIGLDSYSRQVFIYLGSILIYISLWIDCLFEIRKIAVFPLAFIAGWLQGHWWGLISRNYVVWPTFLLMNVFIALKGSHFWFLLEALQRARMPRKEKNPQAIYVSLTIFSWVVLYHTEMVKYFFSLKISFSRDKFGVFNQKGEIIYLLYVWIIRLLDLGQVMKKCVLCHMWTTKVQISLHVCAVWSAPLLFAA